MADYPVHGFTAPGFESLRAVFERNFTDDIEVGASFCAVHDGRTVVDLWGGWQDRACTRPWQDDTLVNVYSTTKGIASIAFATLVEDGLIDYEVPVRDYWPELTAGRNGLTVGQLLSHQGGLCGLRGPVTVADLYDWDGMIRRIEAEEPHWEPGEGAGYHAVLWGYLPGELARRLTGRTLGRILAERVAGPLQADCYLGLPDAEHHRVADLIGPNHARRQPDLSALAELRMPPLYPVALQNPSIRPWQDACSPAWRRAEIAAANAQANARGIARIYGAVARGGELEGRRILAPETIAALTVEEVGGQDDLVLGRPMRRARGVMLNTLGQYGPNPQSFGHAGAGGSVGFADPVTRLGVGYAMNQMQPGIETDTRGGRLIAALYACLELGAG
ncbi:MAG: beta-lactamase family protein [Pseudomonadales bacterium]|nr:beta-lactamase family protein [Pseudomonadales bacterium]